MFVLNAKRNYRWVSVSCVSAQLKLKFMLFSFLTPQFEFFWNGKIGSLRLDITTAHFIFLVSQNALKRLQTSLQSRWVFSLPFEATSMFFWFQTIGLWKLESREVFSYCSKGNNWDIFLHLNLNGTPWSNCWRLPLKDPQEDE